jgi:hypothetical protein
MNVGIHFGGDFNNLGEAMDLLIRLLPILIPLVLVQFILMVTALVSLIKKPNPWNDKILWLLLILLVNLIGPIIYFAVGANHLENRFAQAQDGER